MATAARWRALYWFDDHGRDVNAVMGRRLPSARMRNLMMREGLLDAEQLAFGQHRYTLTDSARGLLVTRKRRAR